MSAFSRVLVLLLVPALLAPLAAPGVRGALERPVYAPGNRWTYVLTSDLDELPGSENATEIDATLQLSARMDVEVVGDGEVQVGGKAVPTVVAKASLNGFLNGTVMIPQDPVPLVVETTGTVAMNATEEWEGEGYWPVSSRGTVTFNLEVVISIVTATISMESVLDVLSSVTYDRTFPLDVGDVVNVMVATNTTVVTTTEVLGMTMTGEASNTSESTVRREVVGMERVSVEAGTFDTYRMEQGIVPTGGLGLLGLPLGTNETAFFAPSVGNYVRRDLYANGTQVGEVRLKSFSFGGALDPLVLGLLGGAAVLAVALAGWWYWRRRGRRTQPPSEPPVQEGGQP